MPAAYIETIMFREQRFVDFRDWIADTGVKLGAIGQSSTGIMQVQPKTAIDAINFAIGSDKVTMYDLGFDTNKKLSADDPDDQREIWGMLNSDPIFCIEVATMNILSCADEKAGHTDFDDFSETDSTLTFARYNGKGDKALNYGQECYDWYLSFQEYESGGIE